MLDRGRVAKLSVNGTAVLYCLDLRRQLFARFSKSRSWKLSLLRRKLRKLDAEVAFAWRT